ncbi:MAG: flagellar type III secretion system protein FliR [Rhizobiales bacterium]|nr:flagellar type III secretion system protein FliR [Hyphomicrobiales bacterium]
MTVSVTPDVIYAFMLIVVRIAAMLMVMPALGESSIPSRIRISLALALALILYPAVASGISPPTGLAGLVGGVGFEIAIGIFIGGIARLLLSAAQVAGAVIAYQMGLAFAQSVDPAQGVQSALLSSFLSVVAVTLIFALDLHHLLIAALVDSYTIFKPGGDLPTSEFATLAVDVVARSFTVATQLAAPFLVFGIVFYVGLGILSRLMPQVQIFFVAMPANIFLGLIIMMLTMSSIGFWFADHFARSLDPMLL